MRRSGTGLRTLLCALLGAFALALWASPAAPAARVHYKSKHSCHNARPGRAACLAMRLLVPSTTSTGTAQARSRTKTRGGRLGALAKKPFPGFLTPERLHAAYQLPDETAEGSTQTIAVVDAFDDPTAEADLAVYDQQFGLPECTSANGCFKKVNQKGEAGPLPPTEGGWATEISIDVQMAHAICQGCHVILVETKSEDFSDLGAGVLAAVKLGASEISNSYGGTEEPGDVSLANADYNHPGILVAASSGDCGYRNTACKLDTEGANFPADSPDVLSVGGTALTESGGVWTSTAWTEGGSACSTLFTAAPWQSSVTGFSATGCGSGRAIADVSAIGDPNTGVDIYDSTPEEPGASTGWGVWGGTSVASPIVAAEWALAGGAHGVSYPSETLYAHAGEASSLYDVTSGSNGKCGASTICNAATGFDGPTGLGSPVGLGAFAISGSPQNTAPPTISGSAEEGATLSEEHGSWTNSPTSYTYQWEHCGQTGAGCSTISGATEQTFKVPTGYLGQTVRVIETAHNAAGAGSAESAAFGPMASDVPVVTGFTPAAAPTGSNIVVEGAALDSATSVTIGELPASFSVLSPSKLQVTVPWGAFKGKISVSTAHGTATSKKKFAATFTIRSFSPSGGAAGTTVTIKGVGFTSSSQVRFDGTLATVLTASAKKLKVTVPAGAGTGPITVTNTEAPAGTISSASNFTP